MTAITIIITIVGFVASVPVGGYLARKQVISDWTLDQEIQWWIDLVRGKL